MRKISPDTSLQLPCLAASPLCQRGDKRRVDVERGKSKSPFVKGGVRGILRTTNTICLPDSEINQPLTPFQRTDML